jgi:hypothetical protein
LAVGGYLVSQDRPQKKEILIEDLFFLSSPFFSAQQSNHLLGSVLAPASESKSAPSFPGAGPSVCANNDEKRCD